MKLSSIVMMIIVLLMFALMLILSSANMNDRMDRNARLADEAIAHSQESLTYYGR